MDKDSTKKKKNNKTKESGAYWVWRNKLMLVVWLFKWSAWSVSHLHLSLSFENLREKPFTKRDIDKVHTEFRKRIHSVEQKMMKVTCWAGQFITPWMPYYYI